MKDFLKNNIALIIGVSLPFLLVVTFTVAGELAKLNVPPLEHDAVFVTNKHSYSSSHNIRVDVKNGKLELAISRKRDKDGNFLNENAVLNQYNTPRIYIFDHDTKTAKELDIDWAAYDDGDVESPDIQELNKNRIIEGEKSPNGYEFVKTSRRSGAGIVGELFSYRSGAGYVLRNKGVSIPIKNVQRFYNADLLGWVEKK